MTDALLHDETTAHDRGGEHVPRTRTLTFDLPAPWLLHGLFCSEAYVSHTVGNATVDVALATDEGYASGMVVPTDGIRDRSFDDYFSGGETHPHDKSSLTFRSDIHDVDAVVPTVFDAVEHAREIRSRR